MFGRFGIKLPIYGNANIVGVIGGLNKIMKTYAFDSFSQKKIHIPTIDKSVWFYV